VSVWEREQGQTLLLGPVEYLDVRIMPLEVYRDSIAELAGTTRDEFEAILAELVNLPEFDLSLQVPLPNIWTPDLDRAAKALHDDDTEEFHDALTHVVARLDTVRQRLLLARAVVRLQIEVKNWAPHGQQAPVNRRQIRSFPVIPRSQERFVDLGFAANSLNRGVLHREPLG